MHEDVRAVLAREEAETLLRVEPLDLAGGHVGSLSPSLPVRHAAGRTTAAARPLGRQVNRRRPRRGVAIPLPRPSLTACPRPRTARIEHPDYRFTLANERTLLAWLRTGLALVAGGVAVATYAPDLGVRWGSGAVAFGLVLIGLGAALGGYGRWRANEDAIRADRPLPRSPAWRLLAAAVDPSSSWSSPSSSVIEVRYPVTAAPDASPRSAPTSRGSGTGLGLLSGGRPPGSRAALGNHAPACSSRPAGRAARAPRARRADSGWTGCRDSGGRPGSDVAAPRVVAAVTIAVVAVAVAAAVGVLTPR